MSSIKQNCMQKRECVCLFFFFRRTQPLLWRTTTLNLMDSLHTPQPQGLLGPRFPCRRVFPRVGGNKCQLLPCREREAFWEPVVVPGQATADAPAEGSGKHEDFPSRVQHQRGRGKRFQEAARTGPFWLFISIVLKH